MSTEHFNDGGLMMQTFYGGHRRGKMVDIYGRGELTLEQAKELALKLLEVSGGEKKCDTVVR